MQEQLFDALFKDEDVSWKTMIYELVKSEKMDPWDINITHLAQRFLEMLEKMKEMNFRISGKIIIAAAILLRIKSNKLVNDDLSALDDLIASSQKMEEEFYEELEGMQGQGQDGHLAQGKDRHFTLIPRTPQPRKRKVSVYDLVEALQKALDVKQRRNKRFLERQESLVEAPRDVLDISEEIDKVYAQIIEHFKKTDNVKGITFSSLVSSKDKKEKIYTFIPLLHLTNQRKVDLEQEAHLTEIYVRPAPPEELTPDAKTEHKSRKKAAAE